MRGLLGGRLIATKAPGLYRVRRSLKLAFNKPQCVRILVLKNLRLALDLDTRGLVVGEASGGVQGHGEFESHGLEFLIQKGIGADPKGGGAQLSGNLEGL